MRFHHTFDWGRHDTKVKIPVYRCKKFKKKFIQRNKHPKYDLSHMQNQQAENPERAGNLVIMSRISGSPEKLL